MNYKNIKSLLPTKWEDITVHQYINVQSAIVNVETELDEEEAAANEIDNMLNIAAKLLNVEVAEVYTIPINEVAYVVAQLSFIYVDIIPNAKPDVRMKSHVDVEYGNYATFRTLQSTDITSVAKNLTVILGLFMNDITKDEILQMNIVDAMTVFFFAQKQLIKLLRTTQVSLLLTLVKQRWQEIKNRIPLLRTTQKNLIS
ncbi:hypothetical protein [Pedobacter sp. L105]|uniref:hypothetical protein n=1 Tax=Pedobacter sp. L105 TaxID=1641871 RepID=UPI00131BE725|nr:hypothetical protein [Pedobacter sp. L105]